MLHFLAYGKKDEIIIDGSLGQIRFATFGKGEFTVLRDSQEPEHFQLPLPHHIQQPLIHSIVDELLGQGACPSTGITGARANWAMGELVKNRVE
ncbi:hypothetical protein [Algoriphagus boritolerans]|uniref:hypothetical protein n=1 Tax=Algoriphagus boritolerans TaxID=308111 RepID=UPI000ACBC207